MLIALAALGALEAQNTITTLSLQDAPGGYTVVYGLNNLGQAVGAFSQGTRSVGFIRAANGTVENVSVSGANSTKLYGINDLGETVGTADGRAFLRSAQGELTTIAVPGASSTEAYGINGLGVVVGEYRTGGLRGGFRRDRAGVYTLYEPISHAGSPFNQPTGEQELRAVNDGGYLLGNVFDTIKPPGPPTFVTYLYSYLLAPGGDRGTFFYFYGPGTIPSVGPPRTAYGLNNKLLVVGSKSTGDGAAVRAGTEIAFRIPDSLSTTAYAVNDSSVIGGTYTTSAGANLGFLMTPCVSPIAPAGRTHGSGAEYGFVDVSRSGLCVWTAEPSVSWIRVLTGSLSATPGTATYQLEANPGPQRTGSIRVGGADFAITQAASTCVYQVSAPATLPVAGGTGSITVTTGAGCPWVTSSRADWITVGTASGTGSGVVQFVVPAKTNVGERTGTVNVAGIDVTVTQMGTPCSYTLRRNSQIVTAGGGTETVVVNTEYPCSFTAVSNVAWIRPVTPAASYSGSSYIDFTVDANTTGVGRIGTLTIAGQTMTFSQPLPLRFVPVAPCRVVDTRAGQTPSGAFGPPFLAANTARSFQLPFGGCNLPTSARAYSLNVTAIPHGYLGYLTVWPSQTGSPPNASTLNSWNGRVVANAAIIPAGVTTGVSVYASNNTDVAIDVNGYFVEPGDPAGLAFYPVVPCRISDSRFSPPTFPQDRVARDIQVSGKCGVPASARAFSLNVTAVPNGYLGYVTLWPTGGVQPFVSTLNSWNGQVVANAALVPAGTNGQVSLYVANATDMVVDVNGYFAPPGPGGLSFYPVSPCRLADTRESGGIVSGLRYFDAQSSQCPVSRLAQVLSLNVTAVPSGYLGFLSVYQSESGALPTSSTLNSWDGQVVANLSLAPTSFSSVQVYTSNPSHVVIDVTGFFAP